MNSNQITNAIAIAFAGFAAWYLLRKPAAPMVVSGGTYPTNGLPVAQAAQVQRDYGLQSWMDTATQQWATLNPTIPQATYDETERLVKRYPAPVTTPYLQ